MKAGFPSEVSQDQPPPEVTTTHLLEGWRPWPWRRAVLDPECVDTAERPQTQPTRSRKSWDFGDLVLHSVASGVGLSYLPTGAPGFPCLRQARVSPGLGQSRVGQTSCE